MAQTEAAVIVRRGVKLLDSIKPNWFKKINLKEFDLGDGSMCVLGQVYGDFTAAVNDIATDAVKNLAKRTKLVFQDEPILDPVYYGFDRSSAAGYEDLAHEWQLVIAKRQKAARK